MALLRIDIAPLIPQHSSLEPLKLNILVVQVRIVSLHFLNGKEMMKQLFSTALVSCLLSSIACISHLQTQDRPSVRTIYEFPNETWIENIAVRPNGLLLTTLITVPELWEIDPFTSKAQLVHRFNTATSVFGIAEIECDLFAVAVGNWSYHNQVQPGTWSIWSVDFRTPDELKVQKVTDILEAHYLEGMTALPSSPGTILSAETTLGLIYRVNVFTGEYGVALSNDAFKPAKDAIVPLGVNGIRIPQCYWDSPGESNYLYFVNTFAAPFLGRIPIDANGSAAGSVEDVVKYAPGHVEGDDFALDCEGNAWVTTNSANSVFKVNIRDRELAKVIGGAKQAVVAGADSAAFGKTKKDSETLYITTTGGIVVPPPSGITGGKIVALDTAQFDHVP